MNLDSSKADRQIRTIIHTDAHIHDDKHNKTVEKRIYDQYSDLKKV